MPDDLHDSNSEVELLKRNNRRLKVSLSIVTALLLIGMGMGVLAAIRQSSQAAQAQEQIERARVAEERALQMVEDAREQTESQNDVEP